MTRLSVSTISAFTVAILSVGCGNYEEDREEAERGTNQRALTAMAVSDCDPAKSIIKNGTFSADLSEWTTEVHDPPSVSISSVLDGKTNKVVRIRNSKVQDFYSVQVWQPLANIQRDHCYRLCFRSKASANRPIKVQVNKNAPPWSSYGLWLPINLGTKWSLTKTEFWATDTATDARLSFMFGEDTAAVYLDDVVLIDRGDIDSCGIL